MEMKVVVNIGDIVGYSDCDFFMDKDAVTVATNSIDESCSIDFENERKRISIYYPTEMNSLDYDVFEEHEVADDWKYLLVSWHCFDGIGSEIKEFSSLIEAQEEMERQATEYSYDVEDREKNKIVVDAGNEWLGWKIIDRRELYEV
jgi:hypothetical protein